MSRKRKTDDELESILKSTDSLSQEVLSDAPDSTATEEQDINQDKPAVEGADPTSEEDIFNFDKPIELNDGSEEPFVSPENIEDSLTNSNENQKHETAPVDLIKDDAIALNTAPPPKNDKKDKEHASAPIIIKRIKKHHGHHGGAWKIAFADFVTAMMAFFLLMWLLAALNKAQKEGVADYFKQPIKVALFGGNSMGDRKESLQGGGSDITQKDGLSANSNKPPVAVKKVADDAAAKAAEMKQLQNIQAQLNESMDKDPALIGLKKQLMMDITKDGLRIQLIDDQNRPMFQMGDDKLSPEMQQVFNKIVLLLKDSPNKITIQGHTDANPYDNPEELQTSNWELSTQRANAARRALVKAGLDENKIMRVTGFASTLLLDKTNPLSPKNRRISIIIMKKEAEDNVLMDN